MDNEITLTLTQDEARMLFRAARAFRAHTSGEEKTLLAAEERLRGALPDIVVSSDANELHNDDIVSRLYSAVSNVDELDDVMFQAGILWRCADYNCRANNREFSSECEECGLPRGAEPADEEPDEGDGSHDFDEDR